MPGQHARRRPRDLAGYLEAISRAVFSAGISWRVVEATHKARSFDVAEPWRGAD
jgi:hypothetical protein